MKRQKKKKKRNRPIWAPTECPNCGEKGPHFVPPSFGDKGFFMCKPKRLTNNPREYKMKKVFLGGTCNESTWRNRIILMLGIDYFNPVVDDWTEDCMKQEIIERQSCDFCLYAITPRMTGVYSIAEVVDDSNKRPEKTILILLRDDGSLSFDSGQWKSLGAVARLVGDNGGQVFDNLKSAANYLNNA